MIVICELNARFLALGAHFVESFRDTLEVVQRDALVCVNGRANNILMADRVRGVENRRQALFDLVEGDVSGRRAKAHSVERCANVARRAIEIAGEFDFGVSDRGYFLKRAVEVALHFVANGIELQADGGKLSLGARESAEPRSENSRAGRFEELATIQLVSSHFRQKFGADILQNVRGALDADFAA